MKRRFLISRDLIFLIALFVVIGALTAFIARQQAEAVEALSNNLVPYSSHSELDSGTLALHNWLNDIGYRSQRIENQAFRIGDDVRMLFIIRPSESISRNEALYLLNWVERGNTLFVADSGVFSSNGLFEQLNVSMDDVGIRSGNLNLEQPLVAVELNNLDGTTYAALKPNSNDYVTYAGGENPTLIRIPRGSGTIWLTSAPALLSNASLRNDENAKFVLALVSPFPSGSAIAFDEYHHGLTNGADNFLGAMYNTPWGWGILSALILTFGYLIINSKRFGRTIPVQRTLARRTPSEYVVSMANLFRRANKRGMVLQHYRHALKRRLGRAFHLNPDMSDEHYIEMLARMRPELDRAELTRILNGLRRAETSEMDLVKSVEQSVTFATRPTKK